MPRPVEVDDETEGICPECAGSGEGLLSPPGKGRCRRCKGSGSVSLVESDDHDDYNYPEE